LAEVVQFAEQFVAQAQHAFGPLQHHVAGGGEVDMRTLALQQGRAEALFQLGDLLADRRLADVQGPGRLGEAALADHLDKAAQLFEIHGGDSRLEWLPV